MAMQLYHLSIPSIKYTALNKPKVPINRVPFVKFSFGTYILSVLKLNCSEIHPSLRSSFGDRFCPMTQSYQFCVD